ncbi:MAG: hypothetical protein PUG10_10200 [Lachnospiraceae bacterium]|nr:hypothetical protein [Lachnospiraceae bacterium]
MINFEEELKRFQPILEVNQAEEAIYSNDLKDISDIVMQMTQEIKNANMNAGGQLNSIVRR